MGTPNSGNQNIQQMTKISWVQVATEIVKQFYRVYHDSLPMG